MCDALRQGVLAECHTIEEPQRADDLVQAWPGNSCRDQMKLEGMHFLQAQSVRGLTKMAAKLRHRMEIGLRAGPSPCRRLARYPRFWWWEVVAVDEEVGSRAHVRRTPAHQ